MIIKFANDKEFEYLEAYSLERDFKNGYTRPSLEVHMSTAQISYNEIESILNDTAITKAITLIGEPIVDEYDEVIETPTSIHENYTIKGKITVEDDILTFKLYKLSDVEIENGLAKQAIDELLIAMEV